MSKVKKNKVPKEYSPFKRDGSPTESLNKELLELVDSVRQPASICDGILEVMKNNRHFDSLTCAEIHDAYCHLFGKGRSANDLSKRLNDLVKTGRLEKSDNVMCRIRHKESASYRLKPNKIRRLSMLWSVMLKVVKAVFLIMLPRRRNRKVVYEYILKSVDKK